MTFRLASWAAMMLALGVSVCAAATARDARGIRLIDASPAGLRFDVLVPEAQLTPPAGDATGTRVELEGYSTTAAPGEAELPARVVVVAVPPLGAVRVTGMGLDETVREGVDVAMAPSGARDAVEPELVSGAPVESDCARLVEVGWMRHQRIARIELRPARWDAESRRLRIYGRVAVSVDVAPTPAAVAAPDSDAFESVYRELLVNYEQGRGWRATRRASRVAPVGGTSRWAPTGLASIDAAQVITLPDTSLFVGRRWIKIAVRRSGFYRLAFSRFKSLAPFSNDTTTASDSLRLFTWPGLPVLPEANYCDTCGYREVALGIVDDDARMNHAGDAIYFYAVGPSDWADRYDSSQGDTLFVNHPYDTRNYYYLGVSTAAQPLPGPRRRITTRDATPTGGDAVTPPWFRDRVHQEADLLYDPNVYPGTSTFAWEQWFWTKVKDRGTFSASTDAPGADTTHTDVTRLPFHTDGSDGSGGTGFSKLPQSPLWAGPSGGIARFRARLWSQFTGEICADQRQFVRVLWDEADAGKGTFGWSGYQGYTIDTPMDSLRRKGNDLKIVMSDLHCHNQIVVSWFDLFYRRTYEPVFEKLEFRPQDGGGTELYRIAPFQSAVAPRLFDITDPIAPVEITGATYTGVPGGHALSFESTDVPERRYVTLPDTSFFDVSSSDLTGATGTSVDNLRGRFQNADYVVIFYDEFQLAADTLAKWRRDHDGFRTKTVPISAIYDQFSGGRTDPTAIRNFLRAAYFNWATQPTYVTFLGDASYDFRNITGRARVGQPGNPLPTYENGFETFSKRQFTTDDWLLNVDDPNVVIPDFLAGRLPVPTAGAAMDVVRNKVLAYERTAPLGTNRDRIMLIADDNQQGSNDDPLHWNHLSQTTLLDTVYTPNSLDRAYVYLHTYPYPSATNFTKPLARDDIMNTVNGDGVFIVNYIGHGSPFKLADESVLLASDADVMTNADRLPLFIAASCDVGKFNDPANTSLGELLLLRSGGGAIGVISATDLAYSGQNAELNRDIYRSLFARTAQGDFSGEIAKALLVGKLDASQGMSNPNAEKYQLLGDAVTRLNLPRYWVDLRLTDDGGLDTTAIQQGRRLSFSGRVLDGPQGALVPLDGTADVLIEDSAPLLQAPPCTLPRVNCNPTPFYYFRAGPVYRGTAEVHAGLLSGRFMVPLEARLGRRGRIRVYLTGAQSAGVPRDAAGDLKLRVASGTLPGGDQQGPQIGLSFPGGATRVRRDATLRIDLSDSSGILITGHTPQNGIVVTLDGNTTSRVEVTDSFRYNPGSFQTGTASFPLPTRTPLSEGFHVVSVSAADNLAVGLSAGQHRSQATLEFEVVQSTPLRVLDTYLFPDPTGSSRGYGGGAFVVDTEGGPVDLQLRIYTVSGRLLRLLTSDSVEGQVQVRWDGLDAEGQGLANGVYLYKVAVQSSGSGSGSAGRKADAQGRFVVLNP